MPSAIDGSVGLVAYLTLFAGVGLLFIFVNLLIGRFVRPHNPHEEKQEIYECGEPAIGSSFVQFDLRFYVVALMFIIFDVEVAFLFPWATVFGKASHLTDTAVTTSAEPGAGILREMGLGGHRSAAGSDNEVRQAGRRLQQLAIVEALVFFVILLLAFAYVWRLGDLDWVRTLPKGDSSRGPPVVADAEPGKQPALSV